MTSYLHITEDETSIKWHLDRPNRGNALGITLAQELEEALTALQDRPRPGKVLVLTATPLVKGTQRTWIAGGDLKELAPLTQEGAAAYSESLARVCLGLERLPMLVLAAVDGAAIGGGAELALAADVRLATRESCFEFKQLQVGLALGYGSTRRLVDLLGKSRAQALMFLSGTLTATEAHSCGLVHTVLENTQALEQQWQLLSRNLQQVAPEAIATQKNMFYQQATAHPGSVLTQELSLFRKLWGNPHHRRFLSRFLAKQVESPKKDQHRD